jgi:hypothetical protein
LTDLLEDDGGLIITKQTSTGRESLTLSDRTTISADTDAASSSDKSLIWNHGYHSAGMHGVIVTSRYNMLVIDGPVTEVGDYKITLWFSNYATGSGASLRPNYLGKFKVHYSHSGDGDPDLVYNQLTGWDTVTHPNGTEFFSPFSWYTGSSGSETQYGDPDYAGNHQNSSSVPALTAMGPWKVETPSFTVTDADELVRAWVQPYSNVIIGGTGSSNTWWGFFLSLIQVTKV